MQPSSLVFVVILGVWAAFFLQYWMRRREMISTARTVEQLTETMRVLAVSAAAPAAQSRAAHHSYGASPTRALRPSVADLRTDGSRRPPARPGMASGTVMRPARSLRGLTLLIGVLGTLVYVGLVVAGAIRAVGIVLPVLMALGGLLWLRAGVRGEIRARAGRPVRRDPVPDAERRHAGGPNAQQPRAGRPGVRRTGEGRATVASPSHGGTAAPAQSPSPAYAREPAYGPAAGVSATGPREDLRAVDEDPYDVDQVAAVALTRPGAEPAPVVEDDDIPTTWTPRVIPPPTYALKARVEHRPVDEPLSAVDPSVLADVDDDVIPLRPRAVNG